MNERLLRAQGAKLNVNNNRAIYNEISKTILQKTKLSNDFSSFTN